MKRVDAQILILLRHFTRLTDILQLRQGLVQSGSSVSLVLLRSANVPPACLEALNGLPCCTVDPWLAEHLDIPLLSAEELAHRVIQADLVMPC